MRILRGLPGRLIHAAVGLAYNLLRASWLVSKPKTRGAHAVAFTPDRRVILVKLSYARGWRLPGGGVERGERPEQAVLRELREEIGMTSHGAVREVAEFQQRVDFKRDTSTLFIVEDVCYEAVWSLEVKEVRAYDLDVLPADLAPITRRLLRTAVSERGKLLEPKLLPEWELWACAHEMIRQHALDAPIRAAMRADELMEQADLDGAQNWRLILHRINELLQSGGRKPN